MAAPATGVKGMTKEEFLAKAKADFLAKKKAEMAAAASGGSAAPPSAAVRQTKPKAQPDRFKDCTLKVTVVSGKGIVGPDGLPRDPVVTLLMEPAPPRATTARPGNTDPNWGPGETFEIKIKTVLDKKGYVCKQSLKIEVRNQSITGDVLGSAAISLKDLAQGATKPFSVALEPAGSVEIRCEAVDFGVPEDGVPAKPAPPAKEVSPAATPVAATPKEPATQPLATPASSSPPQSMPQPVSPPPAQTVASAPTPKPPPAPPAPTPKPTPAPAAAAAVPQQSSVPTAAAITVSNVAPVAASATVKVITASEVETVTKERDAARKEVEALTKEIAVVKERNTASEQALSKATSAEAASQKRIEELQREVQECQAQQGKLVAEKERQLKEKEDSWHKREQDLLSAAATQKAAANHSRETELLSKNEKLEQEILSARSERDELQMKLSKLQEEVKRLENACAGKDKEKAALEATVANLQQQVQSVPRDNGLQEKCTELEKKVAVAEKSRGEMEKKLLDEMGKGNAVQKKLDESTQKLSQTEAELRSATRKIKEAMEVSKPDPVAAKREQELSKKVEQLQRDLAASEAAKAAAIEHKQRAETSLAELASRPAPPCEKCEAMRRDLSSRNEAINKLEVALQETERTSDRLRMELTDTAGTMAELRKERESRVAAERYIAELQLQLDQISGTANTAADIREDNKRLQVRLEETLYRFAEVESELRQLRNGQASAKPTTLAAASVLELQGKLQQAERDNKALTQQLQQLQARAQPSHHTTSPQRTVSPTHRPNSVEAWKFYARQAPTVLAGQSSQCAPQRSQNDSQPRTWYGRSDYDWRPLSPPQQRR
eukprot:TRINITY_DN7010_c0_g1_i1.p1 TRINITY_DN7010_c0_g1~~TRINITY_DN7010_c0_g1_i1.p1  ORF type:complete len:840 (+),score=178.31 TRINITY_DN7010_c0_g1_i1:46-2565(+)